MSNPFAELRAVLDEAEARVAARLSALEQENAFLTKENRELWIAVHGFQDAKTEPPEAAEKETGT